MIKQSLDSPCHSSMASHAKQQPSIFQTVVVSCIRNTSSSRCFEEYADAYGCLSEMLGETGGCIHA